MMQRATFLSALVLLLILTPFASADRIMLRGTSIALPECEVLAIEQGRIVYRDRAGRSQRIEMDEVQSISFNGVPALDEAERRIDAGALADGVWLLLRALVATESDAARLWIRARLARVHDARGEYAEAAAHLAYIVARDEHAHWLTLRPVRNPAGSAPAAMVEALAQIDQALRRVRHERLAAMLDDMQARVRALVQEPSASRRGATGHDVETLSGVPVTDIRDDRRPQRWQPPPPDATDAPETSDIAHEAFAPTLDEAPSDDDSAERGTAEPESPPGAMERGASSAEVDRLLQAERWGDALAACTRIAADPGERELGRFLYQYGRALRGLGRDLDAAVMFTRGALLHPGDAFAVRSLIETAAIYQEVIRRPDAARRLLDRAEREARTLGRDDLREIIDVARRVLDEAPRDEDSQETP